MSEIDRTTPGYVRGDYDCKRCGKVKDRQDARCTKCNGILKGFSLKAFHSQKSDKLSDLDRKNLSKLIEQREPAKLISFLVERAKTTTEAFKILKEFMPYLAPKLQSVQQQIKQDTKIIVEWEGMDAIDVTPDPELIESIQDNATNVLTKESADAMLKEIAPKKRGRPKGSKSNKKDK